jgi:hypothetical protein
MRILLLALAFTVVVFSGCKQQDVVESATYTVQAMEVAAALPQIQENVSSSISILRNVDFGDKTTEANDIFDRVEALLGRVEAITEKDTKEVVLLAANVKGFVHEARSTFYGILDLVEPIKGSLTESQQFELETVHKQLASINRLYEKVEGKGGDVTKMVLLALRATGAGINLVEAYK